MKVWIAIVLFFAVPSVSLANHYSLFPVVLEQRYLENENREYYFQRVNSFAAAATFDFYQLGLEITNWNKQTDTGLIGFKETYSEINSTHLFKMGSTYDWMHFYSGVGIGSYGSKLESQFNGSTTESTTGQILFGSAIFSIQAIYSYLHMALDLKLILAKDYRPEPTPSTSIKVGLAF
jgi:hypothetical protein